MSSADGSFACFDLATTSLQISPDKLLGFADWNLLEQVNTVGASLILDDLVPILGYPAIQLSDVSDLGHLPNSSPHSMFGTNLCRLQIAMGKNQVIQDVPSGLHGQNDPMDPGQTSELENCRTQGSIRPGSMGSSST